MLWLWLYLFWLYLLWRAPLGLRHEVRIDHVGATHGLVRVGVRVRVRVRVMVTVRVSFASTT